MVSSNVLVTRLNVIIDVIAGLQHRLELPGPGLELNPGFGSGHIDATLRDASLYQPFFHSDDGFVARSKPLDDFILGKVLAVAQ